MSRPKLWAGLLILFGAGALTGALAMSWYLGADRQPRQDHGPAARQERIMKRLTQELALTAQQQQEIERIVTRAHVKILELRFSHQDDIEQILAGGMEDMKPLLSQPQRDGLNRLYGELQERWQTSREFLKLKKDSLNR